MPNWCDCDLFVTAETKNELDEFKAAVASEDRVIDANKIIPYPEVYKKLDDSAAALRKDPNTHWTEIPKDGFNSGGYEWCIENWGTKWNFCSAKITKEDENELFYTFETAWSPPIPLIAKMSEMFPNLCFVLKYYEQGMGYKGSVFYEGGVLKHLLEEDYEGPRGG